MAFGFLRKKRAFRLEPLGQRDETGWEERVFARGEELRIMASVGDSVVDEDMGPVPRATLWAILPPGDPPLYLEVDGRVFRITQAERVETGEGHTELRGIEVPNAEVRDV